MSDIPVNPNDPINDPVRNSGEGIAERYVDHELVTSRASLRRTQIIGGLLCLFTIGYMTYLTNGFRASLEPNGAAEIATGLATQRLDDMEPQFADYIHTEVPKMIQRAPDEVIKRLPEYRQELEKRVDTTIRTQAQQGATQLDKQLDDFLAQHKEQVGNLLKNGQDPANLESVGNDLETSFKGYLNDTKVGDETIQQKIDATLAALKQVSARTAKLAANQNLTPEEKKARHAVAMLMNQIGAAKAAEPDAIKPIDPNAVRDRVNEAAANLRDQVQRNLPSTSGTTGGTTPPATPPTTSVPPRAGSAPSGSKPSSVPAAAGTR